MSSDLRTVSALITDGLDCDPKLVERIVRRAGLVCRMRQLEASRRLSGEGGDASWVSGYAGGWGDCADLLGHVADGIGEGAR